MSPRSTRSLVLIAAGAAVNVAITWTTALYLDLDDLPGTRADTRFLMGDAQVDLVCVSTQRVGGARYMVLANPTPGDRFTNCFPIPPEAVAPTWAIAHLCHWDVSSQEWRPTAAQGSWHLDAFGFPMQSMWFKVDSDESENFGIVGGAVVPEPPGRYRGWSPFALPLRIRPIAFAANTLSYAAALGFLLVLARSGRCLRRYRRGLCPVCRYDLRLDYSAGCPECAWHPQVPRTPDS